MSDILFPIALSSQLDITGEERIHAAKYAKLNRSTYTALPARYWLSMNGYGTTPNSPLYLSEDLSSWSDPITISGIDYDNNSVSDMKWMGATIAIMYYNSFGGAYIDSITNLNPITTVSTSSYFVDDSMNTGLRRDISNPLIGYGTDMYTLNGGVTFNVLIQPNSGVISGGRIEDIVRLSSGRWFGSGFNSGQGTQFVYTDEAVPTTWINGGNLTTDHDYDLLRTNFSMDNSAAVVACIAKHSSTNYKVFRSLNDGATFTEVLDLGNPSLIRPTQLMHLSGTNWVLNTFDIETDVGKGQHIYYSHDDCATWARNDTGTGPSQFGYSSAGFGSATALSFANGKLFVGVLDFTLAAADDLDALELWKSEDFGETYTKVVIPVTAANVITPPLIVYTGD